MKAYYYILVTKNGNPATHDYKLPIYWNKNVAIEDGIKFGNAVRRIRINELQKIIL